MYLLWSQFEEAWRDTLIHKGISHALRLNSLLYGLEWPEDEVSGPAWRGALHVEALGRRGTFRATAQAFEAALSDYNEKIVVTIDSGLPYQVRRTDGGTFNASHIGRYVRTPFGLLFTVDASSEGSGGALNFCPVRTRYWDAPGYDADTYDADNVPMEILPFVIYEMSPGPVISNSNEISGGWPCLFEVALFATSFLPIPATYLQENAAGWLITAVDTGSNTLTLSAEGTLSDLVAGDNVYFDVIDDTDTLPAPLVIRAPYKVVSFTAGALVVQLPSGGPAIDLTTVGVGSYFVTRVPDPDLPLGGNLLENENEDGNTDEGGPYPIYLYDGLAFPAVSEVLQGTLPAGVQLVIGMNPLL